MAMGKGPEVDYFQEFKRIIFTSWLVDVIGYYVILYFYFSSDADSTSTSASLLWYLVPSCLYSLAFWLSGCAISAIYLAAYIFSYTRAVPRMIAITYGEEERVEIVQILKQDSEDRIASIFTDCFPVLKGSPPPPHTTEETHVNAYSRKTDCWDKRDNRGYSDHSPF